MPSMEHWRLRWLAAMTFLKRSNTPMQPVRSQPPGPEPNLRYPPVKNWNNSWFHQRPDQTRQFRMLLTRSIRQKRHRNAGYHILFRGGRNEKRTIFGLGSHRTARGDVVVAFLVRCTANGSAHRTARTAANRGSRRTHGSRN